MLWGVKVALGSESCSEGQCCSGEANVALGGNLLWGGNVALGSESCSGEAMLLWGSKLARGREFARGW
ncbi:MAG TPA: hypothetical protein PLB63_03545 [Planctomycetota bacterium]|nr:hypothetical protein [Planctomycetota bacterium]HQB00026.1 hypothetical protein [Planctomycetota bacterium]